jgi:RNA polymerase sigma-70 factor (ECF subfamily)
MSASSAVIAAAYESHYGELRRAAWRICRDPSTAEDLVQEAFSRLIVEVDGGRTPDNIRAWLHRVIANGAISGSRKAATGVRFAHLVAARGVGEAPDDVALDNELRAEVDAMLAGVPAYTRQALVLAAEGFTGGEIARSLGRTPVATRALMSRARRRLREQLGAAGFDQAHSFRPVT